MFVIPYACFCFIQSAFSTTENQLKAAHTGSPIPTLHLRRFQPIYYERFLTKKNQKNLTASTGNNNLSIHIFYNVVDALILNKNHLALLSRDTGLPQKPPYDFSFGYIPVLFCLQSAAWILEYDQDCGPYHRQKYE